MIYNQYNIVIYSFALFPFNFLQSAGNTSIILSTSPRQLYPWKLMRTLPWPFHTYTPFLAISSTISDAPSQ